MSDSDKELKIKITTAADTSGLKQISDALKEVSDSAEKDFSFPGENAPMRDFPDIIQTAHESGGERPSAATALQPALNSLADAARLLFIAAATLNEQLSGLPAQRSAARNPGDSTNHLQTMALAAPGQPAGENVPAPAPAAAAPQPSGFADQSAESLQLGNAISGEQSALLGTLAGLLQATLGSTRDLLDLIRNSRRDQAALQNEIGQLKRSVANLASARGNPGNPTPP